MTTHPTPTVHSVVTGDPAAEHRAVFFHGLFGRGKNFTRIASGLTPEIQSLLVDLPNHGQSSWADDVAYPAIVDTVADHLRRGFASEGPVDVVGHSMGGKVAMVLALRHPELVRRLVVLDISPTVGESTRGNFRHLLDSLQGLELEGLDRRSDADAALREQIPEAGTRGFLLQNLKRGDDGFHWEPNLDLLRQELPTIMGFPDVGEARFTGDVLWIGGELSDYVSDADEPAMRELFPRAIRMTMRGSGHWVHSEKPAETIAALRYFLLKP